MKPYVICHMNSSIDGRILGSRWRPAENRMAGLFERIHEELGGGSWLIGRVTGSEYARAEAYTDHTDQIYPREPWFARREAALFGDTGSVGHRAGASGRSRDASPERTGARGCQGVQGFTSWMPVSSKSAKFRHPRLLALPL
jgi:hypothetical protein